MNHAQPSQIIHYHLPEALTVDAIGKALLQWPDVLQPGTRLVLDASHTHQASPAGIQALLALSGTLAERQGWLLLHKPHPQIDRTCHQMGLNHAFPQTLTLCTRQS